VADALIAFELRGLDGDAYEEQRADEAEKVQLLMKRDADASLKSQAPRINQLSAYAASNFANAARSIGLWNFLRSSLGWVRCVRWQSAVHGWPENYWING